MRHLGVVTCVAVLAAGRPALAERVLSFDQAMQLARENNRDLAAARARLQQASTAVELARVPLIPVVTAGGSYTHNYKEVDLDLGQFVQPTLGLSQILETGLSQPIGIPPKAALGATGTANAIASDLRPIAAALNDFNQTVVANTPSKPIVIQKEDALAGQVNVTVPLVVPTAYPALSAAHRSYESNEAAYQVAMTQVLFGTAQSFYAAAGADEILQARHHGVEVAQKTLDDAQSRLAVGTVNRLEVMRAQLALDQVQQAEREAGDQREAAYRTLATLLLLREPFRVAPPAEPLAAPTDRPPAAEQVLSLRPEVVQYQRGIDAAQDTQTSDWLKLVPNVSAFASGSRFNYASFSGDDYAWAVGAQLNWVLFDGTLSIVQRHLAEAQEEENTLRLEQLRDTISDDLLNAQSALRTKRQALETAERSVALSEEALKLVRSQHDVGTATQLDLLEAQLAVVTVEVQRAQARFDLAMSDINLRRVAGTFPADIGTPGEAR